MSGVDFHPIASLFPMMCSEEFTLLKQDIECNGLIEPIWTHEGQIIDGRNRYTACIELGTQPQFREWSGEGSLTAFVVSLNLKRRHLTSGQRAAIALDAEKWLADEAKQRQRDAGRLYGMNHPKQEVSQKIEQPFVETDPNDNKASAQAAELFGTNRQYVSDLKRISLESPEIVQQVKRGSVSFPQANQLAEMDTEERQEVLTEIEQGVPAKKALASHQLLNSSKSNEWYTPEEYVEAARAVMGQIEATNQDLLSRLCA